MLKLFDDFGRRLPSNDDRVFGPKPSNYYKLKQPDISYNSILERLKENNLQIKNISSDDFKKHAESLLIKIKETDAFAALLNGVHIPFFYSDENPRSDLGTKLEEKILPALKSSFTERFPEAHFKAVLQSDSELKENISIEPNSGYDAFLDDCSDGVIGWYFPQAFQEFDIESQRKQMSKFPQNNNLKMCLSGGIDIGAAITGSPDLLIDKDFYTPILCMSSFVHIDERLILILKAYGPHMEFWLMTQMLSKYTKQVSEQWAGGITIYTKI